MSRSYVARYSYSNRETQFNVGDDKYQTAEIRFKSKLTLSIHRCLTTERVNGNGHDTSHRHTRRPLFSPHCLSGVGNHF